MEPLRSVADSRIATLLLHCELRAGLAADLTRFVRTNDGRIDYHDHYVDNEINRYFTRLQWDLANFAVADGEIGAHVAPLAGRGDARWSLNLSGCLHRMAVFVSREP